MTRDLADPRTRPYYLDFGPELHRGSDLSRSSGSYRDGYRDSGWSRDARQVAYHGSPVSDRYRDARDDRYRDGRDSRDDRYRDGRDSRDDRYRDARDDRYRDGRDARDDRYRDARPAPGRSGARRPKGRAPGGKPSSKGAQAAGRRVPPLVRGTLAVGLLLAVAASVVRAGVSTGGGGNGGATLVLGQGTSSAIQAAAPSGSVVRGTGRRAAVGGPAATACRATYAVTSRSAGLFTAVVTLVNAGSGPVEGWTLHWSYPKGTKLSDGWNAVVSSNTAGSALARDVASDHVLPPGGSTTIGFVGTYDATASRARAAMSDPTQPAPSGFSLNGVTCR